jgi:DNA-binding transcriptional LysR family regulator
MKLARTTLLRNLSVFCVAARTLSFKDAAQVLHLTPSAVSHQIRELERALELSLFLRKTRALELTPAGRLLLADIEPHLQAVESAVDAASPARGRREARVALPPFFATELLIPQLAHFRQRHPDIEIALDSHDTLPREPSPGADLSIFIGGGLLADWELWPLFALRLVVACAPSLKPQADLAGRALLTKMPVFVHRRFADSAAAWAQQADCDAPGGRDLIELDDMYAVARSAEKGLGVALLPCIITDSWFDRGAIVLARPDIATTSDNYVLALRANRRPGDPVSLLRDWIIERFSVAANSAHASIVKSSLVA